MMDRRVVDHMIIVKDQHDGFRAGGHIIQQRGERRRARERVGGLEQRKCRGAQLGMGSLYGGDQIAPEAIGVVIGVFEREPGDRPRLAARPVRQQSGFPIARRRDNKRQAGRLPVIE